MDTLEPSSVVVEYLRASPYPHLLVEVDTVPGAEPRSENVTGLADRLTLLVDKPGGVDVVFDGTIASRGSDHAWTFDELRSLAAQTYDRPVSAGTVKMHVLFLDGRYASGSGGTVLGVAWDNRHAALFKERIEEACAGSGLPALFQDQLCRDAELAVWLHEIGHVLGLVDNGLPMVQNHEDASHPAHDVDSDCVMYWAYEGDAVVERITDLLLQTGNGALDFDARCLEDLAAVRSP